MGLMGLNRVDATTPLTAKQQAVLDCIRDHVLIHGICPTIRDIQAKLGIKYSKNVQYRLVALSKRGLIYRRRVGGHRIWMVENAGRKTKCPHCRRTIEWPSPEYVSQQPERLAAFANITEAEMKVRVRSEIAAQAARTGWYAKQSVDPASKAPRETSESQSPDSSQDQHQTPEHQSQDSEPLPTEAFEDPEVCQ